MMGPRLKVNFLLMTLLSLFLMGCESQMSKDDLTIKVEAYSSDGECVIVVEGIDIDHQPKDSDMTDIIQILQEGAVP